MIKKGIDVRLNIKPGYLHLIHQYAYEGPCRSGTDRQLTKEFDEKTGKEKFANFKTTLRTVYSEDDVNMLEPAYLTWTDEFILKEEQIEKLMKDAVETDLYLFDGVFHQFPASEIAVRFKKPVGIIGCCASTDGVAALRAKGLEAYGFIDPQHAAQQMNFFRVKKAIRNTNVLVVLKNDMISKGVLSTIADLERLKMNLGVRFTYINAEEILDEVNNLTGGEKALARKIAEDLVSGAEKNSMKKEMIIRSAEFYVTTKKMLEKYECNAFTLPCFEICATRRLNKEKFTFCLTHSLLKEEGIPSACESDINVLMAINVLINLTKKAPHMGNTHPLAHEEKLDQSIPSGLAVPSEVERMDNIASIWHAVPTRKMKGIHEKTLPYSIQAFTHSGWGATIRYDYNRDKGETITLLRFHPTGEKMMVVKGKIVAGSGFDKVGCDTGLFFQVDNIKDFFEKQLDFGHHFAWVYGDYVEDIKDLGKILGIDVITA